MTADHKHLSGAAIEGPNLICHFINIELVLEIILLSIDLSSIKGSCTGHQTSATRCIRTVHCLHSPMHCDNSALRLQLQQLLLNRPALVGDAAPRQSGLLHPSQPPPADLSLKQAPNVRRG